MSAPGYDLARDMRSREKRATVGTDRRAASRAMIVSGPGVSLPAEVDGRARPLAPGLTLAGAAPVIGAATVAIPIGGATVAIPIGATTHG